MLKAHLDLSSFYESISILNLDSTSSKANARHYFALAFDGKLLNFGGSHFLGTVSEFGSSVDLRCYINLRIHNGHA